MAIAYSPNECKHCHRKTSKDSLVDRYICKVGNYEESPYCCINFNANSEKKYGELRSPNPMDENQNCMRMLQ